MGNIRNNRIILGYPLDLLLDRDCKFNEYNKATAEYTEEDGIKIKGSFNDKLGGIILPNMSSCGTGNIIIRGKPGTAKSTLALQLVVSAVQKITYRGKPYNGYHSIYISLEEDTEDILNKVSLFGWNVFFTEVNKLSETCDSSTLDGYGKLLLDILPKGSNNEITPSILLPSLSPRNLFLSPGENDQLFTQRYNQLERLLIAYKDIEKIVKDSPKLSFIVIDSVNVFNNNPLTREELNRLFSLFRRYDTIGVFILEEDENHPELSNNNFLESVDYLADMVISLSEGEDKGYYIRYFEIIKSRHQHQVYGKHPFKIYGHKQISESREHSKFSIRLGVGAIKIFPSLHYIVFGTENQRHGSSNGNIRNIMFTEKKLNNYLRPNLIDPAIIMIDGSGGTYKATLSRDFLLKGIFEGEAHVLMIRFRDNASHSDKRLNFMTNESINSEFELGEFTLNEENNEFNNNTKRQISIFERTKNRKKQHFVEIVYKSGYIMPEEFIDIFLEIIHTYRTKNGKYLNRVVLDDIGQIGVSYPLLYSSYTAGELFLTAFVHIVRNYNINLVMTGSTDEYYKSDDIVKRARTLTDSGLTTNYCDVFGYRYVIVKGEGLVADKSDDVIENVNLTEIVPAVIIPHGRKTFEINTDKLQGLVGFDTGKIYRPGLSLYVFQETKMQEAYNKEIKTMLQRAFVTPINILSTDISRGVNVFKTTPLNTAATHDSLGILKGNPIDQTVICTIDEFYTDKIKESFLPLFKIKKNQESINKQEDQDPSLLRKWFNVNDCITDNKGEVVYSVPYFQNVLFIAYNTDYIQDLEVFNWEELYQIISNKVNSIDKKTNNHKNTDNKKSEFIPVDFCISTNETLSCLLLDALVSAYVNNEIKVNQKDDLTSSEKYEEVKKIIEEKGINEIVKNSSDISKSELDNLRKILRLSQWTSYHKEKSDDQSKTDNITKLRNNSALYICWYSELIELLKVYPHLNNKIRIHALPGQGFKGDWYIGILKGSVSKTLGVNILEMLCSEHEEYKRFLRGVGLPTSFRFSSKMDDNNMNIVSKSLNDENLTLKYLKDKNKESMFKPWPYSPIDITLDKLFEIHKNANKRDTIKGYEDIRISLAALCKQLIQIEDIDVENNNIGIKPVIINRINNIIERLSLNWEISY